MSTTESAFRRPNSTEFSSAFIVSITPKPGQRHQPAIIEAHRSVYGGDVSVWSQVGRITFTLKVLHLHDVAPAIAENAAASTNGQPDQPMPERQEINQ